MRRTSTVLLASATAAVSLVAIAPAASAHAAGDTLTLVVNGRGWGHGRGLGQWGARGMADAGKTWQQIIRHYYRDASLVTRPARQTIRVLLRQSADVVVSSERPFAVRWNGGHRLASARGGDRFYRVRLEGTRYVVERGGTHRGPWRRVARTPSPVLFRGGRALLQLVHPSGSSRSYRGALIARRSLPRTLDAIAELDLERYLAGVVPREMPAVWPIQALKAQAVAARTFAARAMDAAHARGHPYDICATARCQVFGGSSWRDGPTGRWRHLEHPRTDAAVRATGQQVLAAGGRPILAQFSSSTGGHTAPGPGLRAVPDPADAVSPYHGWSVRIPASAIERRWPAVGRLERVRVLARNGYGAWGGRVLRVSFAGSGGSVVASGDEARVALGLRSTWFEVRLVWGRYRFTFDMGYGTRHAAVSHLQRRLRLEGFYPPRAPITTYFGPITRESLRKYQRAHGIRSTGYLGPITRGRLNAGS